MRIVYEIAIVKAYFYFINDVNGLNLSLQEGYGFNYPLSIIVEFAPACLQ